MIKDKMLEKLIELARHLPEEEKEKLNCVAQGMVLAQDSEIDDNDRCTQEQPA